jgi:hypothetical protein
MSNEAAREMLTLLAAITAGALLAVAACYLWGRLIGRTARRMRVSQWRAYTAALFPFIALVGSLLYNQVMAPVSFQMFFAFSCPAMIGAFQRWHWGPEAVAVQLF